MKKIIAITLIVLFSTVSTGLSSGDKNRGENDDAKGSTYTGENADGSATQKREGVFWPDILDMLVP